MHTVELDAFYMDIHEVTVLKFKDFVSETGYEYDLWGGVARYSPGDDYPMVRVSWNDATVYAKWVRKRLPTEAEWEYAARGGLVGKEFPWGDDEAVARDYANFGGTDGKDQWDETTAPVGSFRPNGYGLYDMSGNVWEWCADWFGQYSRSPSRNPQGPSTSKWRVLRGGSWYGPSNQFFTYFLRAANRFNNDPSVTLNDLGFRCVSGLN